MPAGFWLVAALGLPVAMLLGCLSPRLRGSMARGLAIAPLPALCAALFGSQASLKLPPLLLSISLALDTPGALLLGAASILWIAAGWYATAWLRGRRDPRRFTVWWLLTLTGSIGVFMATDLVGFYLMFTLVSLAAYGLVVDDGRRESRQIGLIYVAFAILGEAFLLMAFVMLAVAAPDAQTMIREVVAALPASPWRDATLILLVLGFAVKLGLVPFQWWMPLTYRTAPIPAAAVLSGAGVKAGVIGLLQFLPLQAAWPDWGLPLTVLGMVSAFYGVLAGLTRADPRSILGWSSVSQMGVLAAVLGMGLAHGSDGVALAVACYAVNHTLVKGGLFVAIGAAQSGRARRAWSVLLPAAVLAIGLGGLPLTGGWLAKLAVKPVLGDGFVGLLGSLSSAGTTLLMMHFLTRLAALSGAGSSVALLVASRCAWFGLVAASLAMPWVLVETLIPGTLTNAMRPGSLLADGWPILLGVGLALTLPRWRHRLVRWTYPGTTVPRILDAAAGLASAIGDAAERLDNLLRRWPVAATLMLTLAISLAALLLAAS